MKVNVKSIISFPEKGCFKVLCAVPAPASNKMSVIGFNYREVWCRKPELLDRFRDLLDKDCNVSFDISRNVDDVH